MFDKVSTELGKVSAEDMYQDYVKELLKNNKDLVARKAAYIPNGAVHFATSCTKCNGTGKTVKGKRIIQERGCRKCRGTGRIPLEKTYITYTEFKTILTAYNQLAGEKIVNGYTWALGAQLGNIFIARIERPANGRKLDKLKSFQRRRELLAAGTLTKDNWQVPYTDDEFIMVMWHKGNGQLRNIHLYKFKTAGGQPGKGFRFKVSNGIKTRPELKALYPYLPTKKLVPESEMPKRTKKLVKQDGI